MRVCSSTITFVNLYYQLTSKKISVGIFNLIGVALVRRALKLLVTTLLNPV